MNNIDLSTKARIHTYYKGRNIWVKTKMEDLKMNYKAFLNYMLMIENAIDSQYNHHDQKQQQLLNKAAGGRCDLWKKYFWMRMKISAVG